jgi:hypothetical protein
MVTSENESLFRTYHPSLASQSEAYALKERHTARSIRVVILTQESGLIGAHAGGREIHVQPYFESPLFQPAI